MDKQAGRQTDTKPYASQSFFLVGIKIDVHTLKCFLIFPIRIKTLFKSPSSRSGKTNNKIAECYSNSYASFADSSVIPKYNSQRNHSHNFFKSHLSTVDNNYATYKSKTHVHPVHPNIVTFLTY